MTELPNAYSRRHHRLRIWFGRILRRSQPGSFDRTKMLHAAVQLAESLAYHMEQKDIEEAKGNETRVSNPV